MLTTGDVRTRIGGVRIFVMTGHEKCRQAGMEMNFANHFRFKPLHHHAGEFQVFWGFRFSIFWCGDFISASPTPILQYTKSIAQSQVPNAIVIGEIA
jgi:hypothetical protein